MSLPILLNKFQEAFNNEWKKYVEYDQKLIAYRGKEITHENIDAINEIVTELQNTYANLHEALYWIHNSAPNCMLLIKEHKKFMDDLKAAGGIPEKDMNPEVHA